MKKQNNKTSEKQAFYYDKINTEEAFDISKANFQKAKTKRVNMLIPESIFIEAEKISKITGVGYQNTLKTAIAIGLHQLQENL